MDTRKALEFLPYNVFMSTTEDALGNEFDIREDYKDMERLTQEGAKNIVGIQGQLWSETIKGSDMLEYYYTPKILGLAQRAWAQPPVWASIEDETVRNQEMDNAWNHFANVIGQKELHRMNFVFGGYNFRMAPPGVVVRGGQAVANATYPGMTIRYEVDGKERRGDKCSAF